MNENTVRLLNEAKSILITVSKTARLDGVAAALALSLGAISQGKTVRVCTEAPLEESRRLVGADKISPALDLGGNVLKVSFPYRDGAIDKVTYNITDDTFNLLIEPRTNTAPLESKDVRYNYTGGTVDVILTIDAPNLESLGSLYLDNPDVFVQDKIVNVDRRFDNKNFGAENIVDKQSSSTSELVVKLLNLLRWNINPDMATNLYMGLSAATNNFTSFSTNAGSFETASILLKLGARKMPPMPQGGGLQGVGAPMRPPMGNFPPMMPRGFMPQQPGFGPMGGGADPFGDFGGADPFADEEDDFADIAPPMMPPRPLQQQPQQPQHTSPRMNIPAPRMQQFSQQPRTSGQNQQQPSRLQQHPSQQGGRVHDNNNRPSAPQQQGGDALKPKIFKGPSVS